MEPKPNPVAFGFDDEAEMLQIVHETTLTALAAGKPCAEMSDLPPSLLDYNDALLAWHERTSTPYETNSDYAAKLASEGG